MAKRKRVRKDSPRLIPVPDWKHADDIVRRVGGLQYRIEACQGFAKLNIDKIKDELQAKVSGFQAAIDIDTLSLQAFCESRRGEFKKQRSKKLVFGWVGWRKSTSIGIKKTTLDLIKSRLSAAKRKSCIIVKESVDKNALAKLTDELLAKVKAQREEKDVFFVEPSTPEAADYGK